MKQSFAVLKYYKEFWLVRYVFDIAQVLTTVQLIMISYSISSTVRAEGMSWLAVIGNELNH